jgi:hypothetical protein
VEINNIIVIVHLLVRSKKDEPLLNLYLSDTGFREIDNRECNYFNFSGLNIVYSKGENKKGSGMLGKIGNGLLIII